MIEFVFTLDYEIYGNGTGALNDLVYEPGQRLRDVFHKWDARFVAFVEVAEFERIEACGTDSAIDLVKKQVRTYFEEGFEIALHLHPQWYNAQYQEGRWSLDYGEYNLCTLPQTRITEIIERSLRYLRHMAGRSDFTPLSFRAGNWLFQPTRTAANVMAEKGIRLDSSVFKGGLQHNHELDYRRALKNGYYWPFSDDVNEPNETGSWIEVPIYAEMVPPWRMTTKKRLSFGGGFGAATGNAQKRLRRLHDFLRLRYPLKLDFCRMTMDELTLMLDKVVEEDRKNPGIFRPLVAIGHTKDLNDLETVDALLGYLNRNGIKVSTFNDIYPKLLLGKDEVRESSGANIRSFIPTTKKPMEAL